MENLEITLEAVSAMIPPIVAGIPGITALAGGRMDGLGERMGMKKGTRGVRVVQKEDGIIIDLQIIVRFGCRIPEVARQIQMETRKRIEEMTGQRVIAVNVTVAGVAFDEEEMPKEDSQN